MKAAVFPGPIAAMADRTETDHHASRPTTLSPVLKQVLPLDKGFDLARWVIDQDCIIGREPGSPQGIALSQDSKVSKQHVRLRLLGDRIEAIDLKSKNHTFVDGQARDQAALVDGSVLRVGNTLFVLRYEPVRRNDAPRSETALHQRLLGQSQEVRALRATLSQVARSVDPVLLLGPTGTGKEQGARAIHALSPRQAGPFVAINCAAIPPHLAESTLFGHAKGAFTGAERDQDGVFQQAHRGTLFLDELAELPLELQAKLLRALQPIDTSTPRGSAEHILHIQRLGAREPSRVDVRLVAATNSDLGQAVGRSAFREDLLQRLAVLPVRFPSLDQRRDDILPLLIHALNIEGSTGAARAVDVRLGERLLLHHWSGNVRELFNVSRRMQLLVDAPGTLGWDDLPSDLQQQLLIVEPRPVLPKSASAPSGPESAVETSAPRASQRPPLTREILEALLVKYQGNRSLVARELKRDRKTIRRRMDELGIPRSFACPEGAMTGESDEDHDDADDSVGP